MLKMSDGRSSSGNGVSAAPDMVPHGRGLSVHCQHLLILSTPARAAGYACIGCEMLSNVHQSQLSCSAAHDRLDR